MTKPAPQGAHWYDVPAGVRPSKCRGESCNATIYWIKTPKGRNCPVDCDVEGGFPPTEAIDPRQLSLVGEVTEHAGRGVSHFQTCLDVKAFS